MPETTLFRDTHYTECKAVNGCPLCPLPVKPSTSALAKLTALTHEANAGIARVNASQVALAEALAHVERVRQSILELGGDIVAERQSREAQIVADSASLRAITERGYKRQSRTP